MLASTNRFHGRDSLQFVYRRGQQVRGSQLNLRYICNARRTTFRSAIVVSKKVHKSAVLRNRLRRRIYEIIRTGPAILGPYDLLISVFSDQLVTMPPTALRQQIEGLLRRSGAYANAASANHDIVKPTLPDTGRL